MMASRIGIVLTAAALSSAVLTAAPVQAAPVFNEPAYMTCTATTPPGPDGNVDAVVTDCCVNNGGLPEPTRFGLGCVAQLDNPPPDYRPTIVMPMRADLNLPDDAALEELEKLPPLPPPP